VELEALERRLKTLLPEEYQESYEDLEPVSMGTAGLKFGPDGRVAWDEIWGSFCDLAMAGGPPHKGALLEPGAPAEIDERPERYEEVVEEICRGVTLATELVSRESPTPGWIRAFAYSEAMAGWLLRAIVMENVAVRGEAMAIDLPAAPHFRLEKEIKNVVTVIAKTCHYWLGHMPREQHRAIADLFAEMGLEHPLLQPAVTGDGQPDTSGLVAVMTERIPRTTGLHPSDHRYTGWLGVECPSVRAAVWMMRALIASNVLSRREGTVLFVPVDPVGDPDGERVGQALARIRRLAGARGIL
jgi:hypothetical protein